MPQEGILTDEPLSHTENAASCFRALFLSNPHPVRVNLGENSSPLTGPGVCYSRVTLGQ